MKTLKFLAALCLGLFALVGCEATDDNGGGSSSNLLLVVSSNAIYDNGEDCATFTLYYQGQTLNEGYEIYMGETPIEGNTFTSTTQGTFTFWAAYGTVISNEVSVNVIATPPPAPAVPEDANPSKTNFVRRVMLTQFTGTNCPQCPLLVNALYRVSLNAEYADKYILTAAHIGNYATNDPAFLYAAQTLDDAMNVSSYPNLVADLDKDSQTQDSYVPQDPFVTNAIKTSLARTDVKGGIAINSKYYADELYITANVLVKAASTTEFRVGAWLLEDNIEGGQNNVNGWEPAGDFSFDTHNNCIRIADSRLTNKDFSGHKLGTIEAGKTVSKEFAFQLKPNGEGGANYWNHDNLRLVVFISTKDSDGEWRVNNIIKAPKEGSVDFEYEN